MFNFLFKSVTYLILWKKFKKQIILIVISMIMIALISSIYEDLFNVIRISDKDSLFGLLLLKWFLISLVIGFNIYYFKNIELDEEEKKEIYKATSNQKVYPKKSQEVLKSKKKLQTTTDIILKKYSND